jgi:carbamoyltransferase
MLVLGITNNDLAGACLVDGEVVLAAASEERFTRIKDHKTWPRQSIAFVLAHAGITLDAVDHVAYGWCAGFDADRHLLLYVDRVAEEATTRPGAVAHLRRRIADEIANDREKRSEFDRFLDDNGLRDRAVYIDHHEAHALGAFVCSPFDDSLVLTCDGRGDFQSLTVSFYSPTEQRVLQRETSVDSLGYFYGRITSMLGFRPNRHEGKITGLAAHGDPERLLPLMRQMIDLDDGRLRARCGPLFQPSYHFDDDQLASLLANEEPADVAAAAQAHVENLLTAIVSHHIRQVPTTNLCLGGGVFGNVKLNQRLLEVAGVENVYVAPPMGDGGLPLHAAVGAGYLATGARPRVPSMALGPDSTLTEPELGVLRSTYPDLQWIDDPDFDLPELLLAALEANQVLGVYRGRMEFGPRALGRRSVIYRADDPTMNDWLNKRLRRTEFMPFAPITAEPLASDCYLGWQPTHPAPLFMTITYGCTAEFRAKCPAVVHIDGTARPQVVRHEDDPFLHDLLMAWHERTGQQALVNTSFNKHEEPIVGSPRDALDSVDDGIVDLVVLDDRLVAWRRGNNAFMERRLSR